MTAAQGVAASQPRVATIQDFSCYGRCSLTIALPVISAAGVEVCAIPSEVLSAHTGGLGSPVIIPLTDELPKITEHWRGLGLRFDVIYIGYLASGAQTHHVMRFADIFHKDGALLVVDPAMGDAGRLYGSLDTSVVEGMRELCARADVIIPNLTEAALLARRDYDPAPNERDTESLLDALLSLGAKSALLTGINRARGAIGVAVREREREKTEYIETAAVEGSYHGSGDLFSSVVAACLARSLPLTASARLAADFVRDCLELTAKTGGDEREGVRFEPLLGSLRERLSRGDSLKP